MQQQNIFKYRYHFYENIEHVILSIVMTGKFYYKKELRIINNSYWGVGDFTLASIVYVTVNGFPSNV